jgi:hypothetical protein
MNPLVPCIWVAGAVQLLIVAMNIPLPRLLRYRENLSNVSAIIRQIFIVHSLYIILTLIGFSLLCFWFAADLVGESLLGRFLSGFLAVFWLLRFCVQLFYYDAEVKRRYRLVNLAFLSAVLFLGSVFSIAASGLMK